jgi:hypothetical protein
MSLFLGRNPRDSRAVEYLNSSTIEVKSRLVVEANRTSASLVGERSSDRPNSSRETVFSFATSCGLRASCSVRAAPRLPRIASVAASFSATTCADAQSFVAIASKRRLNSLTAAIASMLRVDGLLGNGPLDW